MGDRTERTFRGVAHAGGAGILSACGGGGVTWPRVSSSERGLDSGRIPLRPWRTRNAPAPERKGGGVKRDAGRDNGGERREVPSQAFRGSPGPLWAAPGWDGPHRRPGRGCAGTGGGAATPRSGSCHRRRDRTTCNAHDTESAQGTRARTCVRVHVCFSSLLAGLDEGVVLQRHLAGQRLAVVSR